MGCSLTCRGPRGGTNLLGFTPMASIERRGDSIRVSWRLGGGREGARQSCTFSGDPESAREKIAATAKDLVQARSHNMTRAELYEAVLGAPDEPVTTAVPTFKQWAGEWIETLAAGHGLAGHTVKKYERCLRLRAVPYLGHLRMTDIDRDMIVAWVKWLTSAHITGGNRNNRGGPPKLAAQTITDIYWVVSACLSAAVPKLIPVNPAARLPGEKKNFIGLPKLARFDAIFLTPQETGLIVGQCGAPLRDMVTVALRSGMRVGELMALDARHVVFPRSGGATILVRATAKADGTVGPPKSEAGSRDITVGGVAAEILEARARKRRPSQLMFPDPKGGMWEPTVLRKSHWYRSVAAAQRCPEHLPQGVPGRVASLRLNHVVSTCDCPGVLHRRPRIHDLRHTHASVLIAQGWHAKKIQARLGHSTYLTTMGIYGHLMDLGDEGELNVMDSWFNG
jgi:integrase